MKKILAAIEQMSPEKRTALSHQLKLAGTATNTQLVNTLLSFDGFQKILEELSIPEIEILSALCTAPDGLTYGEIEKKCNLNSVDIDNYTNRLHDFSLIYILRNRQRFHNKLDKIYCYEEIASFVNPCAVATLHKKLESLNICSEPDQKLKKIDYKYNKNSLKLVTELITEGGLLTLPTILGNGNDLKTVLQLQKDEIVEVCHMLSYPATTIVILTTKAPLIAIPHEGEPVNNGYNLLLNMLHVYDVISSYGLFLTRQNRYRKIDFNHLTNSLTDIYSINAKSFPVDYIGQLAIYLLSALETINKTKDAIFCTLDSLKEELDEPLLLVKKIITALKSNKGKVDFLDSEIKLPDMLETKKLLNLCTTTPVSLANLRSIYIINEISNESKWLAINQILTQHNLDEKFSSTLDFLIISGMVAADKNGIYLTEIGSGIINHFAGKSPPLIPARNDKNIYINPDFSLIIPVMEIPPKDLYILMSHLELLQADVILRASITKKSIVRAFKRGMSVDVFLKTLEKHAQNRIPQNLEFLINEWVTQTVKTEIISATLLKVSHSAFMDEIKYSPLNKGIIENISPTHALIRRDFIDDIIKFARERDAIIKIYETLGDIKS